MSAQFIDGPAADTHLDLRNCPHFLRVVSSADGKIDALDQPGDTPTDDEVVHIYVLEKGSWGQVFVRPGGRFEYGRYRHLPMSLEIEACIRDRDGWVDWARHMGNAAAVAHGLDPWEGLS